MLIHNEGPKLTPERIASVETKCGIVFPPEYRQFLLAHNGGEPEPAYFTFRQGYYGDAEVRELVGIEREPFMDFEELFRLFKWTPDIIPPETVPIGSDTAGNIILLTVSGDGIGTILLQVNGDEGDESPHGPVYILAPSFPDFLKQLQEVPEMSPLFGFNLRQALKAKQVPLQPPEQFGFEFDS